MHVAGVVEYASRTGRASSTGGGCLNFRQAEAMPVPELKPSPMSLALDWVSRIFAVSLLMLLPGLAGQWLDRRWGTSFLSLFGFAGGLILGIYVLIALTKMMPRPKKKDVENGDGDVGRLG